MTSASLVNDEGYRAVQRDAARRGPGLTFPAYAEPWHQLSLPDQRALERAARAVLTATLPGATAALVRRGRCPQLVAAQMRAMSGRLPDPKAPGPGHFRHRRPAPVPPEPEPRRPRTSADAETWDII